MPFPRTAPDHYARPFQAPPDDVRVGDQTGVLERLVDEVKGYGAPDDAEDDPDDAAGPLPARRRRGRRATHGAASSGSRSTLPVVVGEAGAVSRWMMPVLRQILSNRTFPPLPK
jgi:hypothetical protein